jgi:hypothetical protein
MFERILFLHLRIAECRRFLEEVSTSAAFFQQPHYVHAPAVLVAQTFHRLPLAASSIRAYGKCWLSALAGDRATFPTPGFHRRVMEVASTLLSALPQPAVPDAANIYGISDAQWIAALTQFTNNCHHQHLVLPSSIDLAGEFDAIRDALFAAELAACAQPKQTAAAAAQTALANVGNQQLMSTAENEKAQLYAAVNRALFAARTDQQREQVQQLLTQGYSPLDQISD